DRGDLRRVGGVRSVLTRPVGDRRAMPSEAEPVRIERERAGEARVADGDGAGRVDAGVEFPAGGPEAAVDAGAWHQVVDLRLDFSGRVTHASPILEPFARTAIVEHDRLAGHRMRIVEGDRVGRGPEPRLGILELVGP